MLLENDFMNSVDAILFGILGLRDRPMSSQLRADCNI